jgi:hypothetical protein
MVHSWPDADKQALVDSRPRVEARAPLWRPNPDHADGTPNTQRLAYESKATVIGLSGTAGWGKTDCLLGLAAEKHTRSVIFRRVFPNLRSVIERSREVFNPDDRDHSKDSFNESLHRWSLDGGRRMVEFEACQYERDKLKQRGRPRDFYAFDEATEFTRSQIEFITGWLRTTDPKQHLRIILAFNVPTDESGSWVVDYFLPWIAYLFPQKFSHPNPAAPGELRYYATVDGRETECADGEPFQHGDELIKPVSRTFYFGTLLDNPHMSDDYKAILQSSPEPLRSQLLYGNFAAEGMADPWQVLPTAWVKAAQKRWLEREKPDMPLSGVGVDVARGGRDSLTICKRYGSWFDEIGKTAGVNVEDGPAAAGIVQQQIANDRHIGYISVDVIGVGSSAYDSLHAMYEELARPINVAEGSDYVAMSNTDPPRPLFRMRNIRAEMYWRFREMLDPERGSEIALPPDNEMVADLCAARYKVMAGGVIQIEEKDKIKERIGRSPDVGEAVLLAAFDPPERTPGIYV